MIYGDDQKEMSWGVRFSHDGTGLSLSANGWLLTQQSAPRNSRLATQLQMALLATSAIQPVTHWEVSEFRIRFKSPCILGGKSTVFLSHVVMLSLGGKSHQKIKIPIRRWHYLFVTGKCQIGVTLMSASRLFDTWTCVIAERDLDTCYGNFLVSPRTAASAFSWFCGHALRW